MAHEHRYFISQHTPSAASLVGQTAKLSAEDSHHLKNVLRGRVGGSLVVVVKETNRAYVATINALDEHVSVTIESERTAEVPPSRIKSLTLALLKGDHNDLVCEKVCELGVQQIIFWQATRSVARLKPEQVENKLARWRKIAESAAMQSAQVVIPGLHFAPSMSSLTSILNVLRTEEDSLLCCSLSPTAKEIRNLIPPSSGVHLLIGPEGDFSAEEEQQFTAYGFEPTSLGPCRLRAETAAIVASAMVLGVWGHH